MERQKIEGRLALEENDEYGYGLAYLDGIDLAVLLHEALTGSRELPGEWYGTEHKDMGHVEITVRRIEGRPAWHAVRRREDGNPWYQGSYLYSTPEGAQGEAEKVRRWRGGNVTVEEAEV